MVNDISASFVKNFEADVHLAYQQMGSKLKVYCGPNHQHEAQQPETLEI